MQLYSLSLFAVAFLCFSVTSGMDPPAHALTKDEMQQILTDADNGNWKVSIRYTKDPERIKFLLGYLPQDSVVDYLTEQGFASDLPQDILEVLVDAVDRERIPKVAPRGLSYAIREYDVSFLRTLLGHKFFLHFIEQDLKGLGMTDEYNEIRPPFYEGKRYTFAHTVSNSLEKLLLLAKVGGINTEDSCGFTSLMQCLDSIMMFSSYDRELNRRVANLLIAGADINYRSSSSIDSTSVRYLCSPDTWNILVKVDRKIKRLHQAFATCMQEWDDPASNEIEEETINSTGPLSPTSEVSWKKATNISKMVPFDVKGAIFGRLFSLLWEETKAKIYRSCGRINSTRKGTRKGLVAKNKKKRNQ